MAAALAATEVVALQDISEIQTQYFCLVKEGTTLRLRVAIDSQYRLLNKGEKLIAEGSIKRSGGELVVIYLNKPKNEAPLKNFLSQLGATQVFAQPNVGNTSFRGPRKLPLIGIE